MRCIGFNGFPQPYVTQGVRKMKNRMSNDDIQAMVYNVKNSLCSYRVSNIYDINSGKTYVFKLSTTQAGLSQESKKVYLLIESGIRFHTTMYARKKPDIPSQFTMKLRKHIRTKRLTSINQLGDGDRVVDFYFGEGDEYGFHMIVEFYAMGNIILTDNSYNILSLLRVHRYEEEQVKVAVRQVYPVQIAAKGGGATKVVESGKELCLWMKNALDEMKKVDDGGKKKKKLNLRQLLLRPGSGFEHMGPGLVEHCIEKANGSMKVLGVGHDGKYNVTYPSEQLCDDLVVALKESVVLWEKLVKRKDGEKQGFVMVQILEDNKEDKKEETMSTIQEVQTVKVVVPKLNQTVEYHTSRLLYKEYVPLLYAQHEMMPRIEFDTLDAAVDEYYSKIETQHEQGRMTAAKSAAQLKYEKAEKDQQHRIQALEQVQHSAKRQAELIELNKEDVENVLLVLKSALDSGMNWDELHELVQLEQKNGNPVANLIHSMDLARHSATIIMQNESEVGDGDALANIVQVDIHKTAMANARDLYTRKKDTAVKVKKTIQSTDKVLTMAKKNAKKAQEKQELKQTIHALRKIHWWEKFHWFISSENYLVIAGHDAQQNELLVKRYLRKGDVYVHADIHGAASCIVRNTNPKKAIPQLTLDQAGTMTVCRSAAWSSHVLTSAWWVYHDQVSKTAPSGEYLTTGSFMIRGKKNFINPSRLEMGLAILFKIDESCIARHLNERKPRDMCLEDAPVSNKYLSKSVTEHVDKLHVTNEHEKSISPKASNEDTRKKKLSAKERKLLKKGTTATEESDHESESDDEQPSNPTAEKSEPITRGMRRKMKKIKKKYLDQDDEDRVLSMKALGNYKPEEVIEEQKVATKSKPPRRETSKNKEIKQIMQEENIVELPDDEKVDDLDSFTGMPHQEDIVHSAIAVCAPYGVLSSYKYKAKLTPGTLKKGKACKQIMQLFSNATYCTNAEKSLFKCITDNELVAACLPHVKVSAPGIQKMKKGHKKRK